MQCPTKFLFFSDRINFIFEKQLDPVLFLYYLLNSVPWDFGVLCKVNGYYIITEMPNVKYA